jgi:dihydrolipoamide dehydrogenase
VRLVVIGAGPGGYVAALKAAQLGAQVQLVEDTQVGGTCLNRGCIPTKTLLASAELLRRTRELQHFGLQLEGSVKVNLQRLMERKQKVISTQAKGIRALLKSWGVQLLEGRGMLLSPEKVEVQLRDGSTQVLQADRIILATGSRPAQIPTFPFDGKHILSSDDALELQELPQSLLIVGAGVIGSEFAFIFSSLGVEVVMVEMLQRAVATEDEEISALLEREFKKQKIKLLKGVKVQRVEGHPDGVHAVLSDGTELKAQKMLVSIGRALNTQGIGLEAVGVKTGPRGEVEVDDRMQTNIEGIYAVGDITGKLLLAHVASRQGLVAAQNACGQQARMDYSVVPAAIFTSPEIGSVGLREQEARQQGIPYRVGTFPYRALGKAHAMGEISGFVKLIAHRDTDRLLGAHIIGPHASDLVHEAALAMAHGLKASQLAHTIHAHPTLAEALMEAAEAVHGQAIHLPKQG